jgi:hypothetical protein
MELLGPEAGPTGLADGPTNRWDGIDQRLKLLRVMDVGGGERGRERNALSIDDHVVLGAALAPIGRIRAGGLAPDLFTCG